MGCVLLSLQNKGSLRTRQGAQNDSAEKDGGFTSLSFSLSLFLSRFLTLYNSRSLALFPSPSLPPSLSISLYLLSRSLSLSRFLTYNSLNSLTLSFSLAFSLAFSLSFLSLLGIRFVPALPIAFRFQL